MDATATPRRLDRRQAYALIAAEARLLEDYRGGLQRELASVDGRIRVLGVRYSAGAEQPSLDVTGLWG